MKVSVIVPIYNSQKYLDKCIKSILNQTYKKFELILVNDGSKDNSLSICNKYKSKDNRVIVIDKKNEGSIVARNIGIKASNSDYVMFIDSDDWIDKNTLQNAVDEMLKNNTDVVVFNMYKVIGATGLIRKKNSDMYFKENKVYQDDEIRKKLVIAYFNGHPFPSSLCAKLYRKEYLLSSGKYLKYINFLGDDLFYNMEILLKVKKVSIINKYLYYYRAGGNTSKYMPHLFEDAINGYKIQKKVLGGYYQDLPQDNGISIMLLNTMKTCLYNLFLSDLSEKKIREVIKNYLNTKEIIEACNNEGSKKYFKEEFIKAITENDIDYFYKFGEKQFKKKRIKRIIMKLSKYI